MIEFGWLEWLEAWLSPAVCWKVTLALLHSIWQGVLAMVIAAAVIRTDYPRSAQLRFPLLLGLLLLVGASPLVNLYLLSPVAAQPRAIQIADETYRHTGKLKLYSISELNKHSAESIRHSEIANGLTPLGITPTEPAAHTNIQIRWTLVFVVAATLVYLCGVLAMLGRLCWGLFGQWRAMSRCVLPSLSNSRHIKQLQSIAQSVAGKMRRKAYPRLATYGGQGTALVIGSLRPYVLVNASLFSGLTPEQLEQIVTHELAHVYRFDPLTQLFQRLAESIMFFHPAVWYISREVSRLREVCCDEWVTHTHPPLDYADTLLRCLELQRSQANQPSMTPAFSLAALGASSSQLASRVRTLVNMPNAQRPHEFQLASGLVAPAILLIALTIGLLGTRHRGPSLAQHPATPPTRTAASDEAWKWEATPSDQINSSNFLFGGALVQLQPTVPSDVDLDPSISKAELQFGQWQYGDYESTSVGLALVDDLESTGSLHVDRNRDRKLTLDERVTTKTPDGQAWVMELDTEVHEDDGVVHALRQIGIARTKKGDRLRIVSLGRVVGETALASRTVSVARVDLDGNGLTTDARDQIWLDLNDDGAFDLISERFNVRSSLDVEDTRYSVLSDRVGQHVQLTPNDEQGTVEFEFRLADDSARVESLEGTLRDENGMVVAVRSSRGTISAPAGHYTLNALVLQVRDAQDATWRITLNGGQSQNWFEVNSNDPHKLELLTSLQFELKVQHASKPGWDGRMTQLKPVLRSGNGLVVTNFICTDSQQTSLFNDSVMVSFAVQASAAFNQFGKPTQCQSSFG